MQPVDVPTVLTRHWRSLVRECNALRRELRAETDPTERHRLRRELRAADRSLRDTGRLLVGNSGQNLGDDLASDVEAWLARSGG